MHFQSLLHRVRTARIVVAVAALALCSVVHAGVLETDDPDANPNLGLVRPASGNDVQPAHVNALAFHPNGGVIVGGEFIRTADGATRMNLLRLFEDGTLDTAFKPEISSNGETVVNAVAADATGIYVGGRFDKVNGKSGYYTVAKLDLQGNLVEGWDPGSESFNDVVYALAIVDRDLYVGGNFVIGANPKQSWGLMRVDADTGVRDVDWHIQLQTQVTAEPNIGARGTAFALEYTGSDLIVGGNFAQIGRMERSVMARVSLQTPATGQVEVMPFNAPFSNGSNVYAIEFEARTGAFYAGGGFFLSGSARTNLVRFNANGTLDEAFFPKPSAYVKTLALGRGMLYYGGVFANQDGPYLVRTSTRGNGTTDSTWLPLPAGQPPQIPHGQVDALLWQGGAERLWVGGEFIYMGQDARNGLARFSFAGTDTIFRDGFED